MVELQTARLVLRELTEDDAPAMNAVDADPEVARWNGFDPPTLDESRGWVAANVESASETPRQFYTLVLVTKADNQVVGRCGFDLGIPHPPQGMIGYALRRDRWGQGYMTEAVLALIEYGFRQLELHRLWAECDPGNIGSWRVLEKVGMRREGHLIENFRYPNGEWVDSYHYAILAREWE